QWSSWNVPRPPSRRNRQSEPGKRRQPRRPEKGSAKKTNDDGRQIVGLVGSFRELIERCEKLVEHDVDWRVDPRLDRIENALLAEFLSVDIQCFNDAVAEKDDGVAGSQLTVGLIVHNI